MLWIHENKITFDQRFPKGFIILSYSHVWKEIEQNDVLSKLVYIGAMSFAWHVIKSKVIYCNLQDKTMAYKLMYIPKKIVKLYLAIDCTCLGPVHCHHSLILWILGMLTLGVLLPPSYHVETWGLLDVGQLGPAPR